MWMSIHCTALKQMWMSIHCIALKLASNFKENLIKTLQMENLILTVYWRDISIRKLLLCVNYKIKNILKSCDLYPTGSYHQVFWMVQCIWPAVFWRVKSSNCNSFYPSFDIFFKPNPTQQSNFFNFTLIKFYTIISWQILQMSPMRF